MRDSERTRSDMEAKGSSADKTEIVPVASIIIVTLGNRDTIYEVVDSLQSQILDGDFEVVVVSERPLEESRLRFERTRVICCGIGVGISHSRNVGIDNANASILVFIDDDEKPQDDQWLRNITRPIIETGEQVTTSGMKIPLGQGFRSDLISTLGFPGGGAQGFRTMWPVDDFCYTKHLVGGNFAILSTVMEEVGCFDETQKHSCDDTLLGSRLITAGNKIKYVEDATTIHRARGSLIEYARWLMVRGRGAYELHKKKELRRTLVKNRFTSTMRILKANLSPIKTPAIIGIVLFEYFFQAVGYASEMISQKLKAV